MLACRGSRGTLENPHFQMGIAAYPPANVACPTVSQS